MNNNIDLSILNKDEWYTSESRTGTERWIWKLIDISASKTEVTAYKHCTPSDGYKSTSQKGSWYVKDFKYLNKADMDEVYKFFPEEKKNIDRPIDLLAEAKRRYPVGTVFKSAYNGDVFTVKTSFTHNTDGNIQSMEGTVYFGGKWAEIISTSVSINSKQILELNDKSVLMSLPSKWCVKDCTEVSKYAANRWQCAASVNHNSFYHEGNTDIFKNYTFSHKIENDFTEITFEQFKKWVLKEDKYKTESEFLSKYDLINGECYNVSDGDTIWIVRYGDENSYLYNFISYYNDFYHGSSSYKYKKASFSERQWLEACIKANKFISKEEALKDTSKKYTIAELKANTNLVVKCNTVDEANIISKLFDKTAKDHTWVFPKPCIIWSSYSVNNYVWNPFTSLSGNQIVVEYSDVIFDISLDSKLSWYENEIKDFQNYWKTGIDPCDYLTKAPVINQKESDQYNWNVWGDVSFSPKTLGLKEYTLFNEFDKSSNLEFQTPVIINNKKSNKNKLITIKQ